MNSYSWKIELINHRCGSYKAWDLLGILNFEITSPTGDCHSKSIGFWRIFIDHKFQGSEWQKIFEQNLYQFVKWGIAVIERLIDMNKLDEGQKGQKGSRRAEGRQKGKGEGRRGSDQAKLSIFLTISLKKWPDLALYSPFCWQKEQYT